MNYYLDVRYINEEQKEFLETPEAKLQATQYHRLTKKELVDLILIRDYMYILQQKQLNKHKKRENPTYQDKNLNKNNPYNSNSKYNKQKVKKGGETKPHSLLKNSKKMKEFKNQLKSFENHNNTINKEINNKNDYHNISKYNNIYENLNRV